MELSAIQKLIARFPDGPKKAALLSKLSKIQAKERSGGGLHDEFSFKPKGHIMIEEIDNEGNVVGVLADQPNIVVNGSEEILLRAFSGDPKRILYKNRKIKEYKDGVNNIVGKSKKYSVDLPFISTVLNGEDVVAHHQNEIWKAVNDEDFEIEYSYYPNTLYVKQENVNDEPGKITFRVYDKANAPAGAAPLTAEVYSTFTNLFIGLGDGLNKEIALTDARLKFTNGAGDAMGAWSNNEGVKETIALNDKLSFEEKISNVEFTFLKSNVGGQAEIFINDASKGIIDLYDSQLADSETKEEVVFFNELVNEVPSKVEVRFIGFDQNIVGVPKLSVKKVKFDAFQKSDNGLIHEFENFTLKLDTPAVYNTTSEANSDGTYTVHLEHLPVVPESVVVDYSGIKLERVETLEEIVSGKFFVDAEKGIIHFKNALTGLQITYEVTGEIFEDEPKTNLTTASQSIQTEVETNGSAVTLTSALDGVNTRFSFGKTKIVSGSETIVLDLDGEGVQSPITLVKDKDYTLDSGAGEFELIIGGESQVATIPASPATLKITAFKYMNPTTVSLPVLTKELNYEVREQEIRLKDHTGNEFEFVDSVDKLAEGKFTVVADDNGKNKKLVLAKNNASSEEVQKIEVYYFSDELPGIPTNYTRQVILKPKNENEYPWFALDKGSVSFVAEFPEGSPSNNVTVREMALFDGPRVDDSVRGFTGYPVKAFSLVRIGETRKEATTGLRVTWTITLLNEEDQPFKGGL